MRDRLLKLITIACVHVGFNSLCLAGVIESTFMRVGISPFGSLFYHGDGPVNTAPQGYFYIDYTSGGTGIVRKSDDWAPLRYGPAVVDEHYSVGNATNWSMAYFAPGSYGANDGSAFIGFAPSGWTSTWTSDSGTVTGTTATLLKVTHEYSFAAPNILMIDGQVTNNSTTAQPVWYKRAINWSVTNSPFYQDGAYASAIPSGTQLIDSTISVPSYGLGPAIPFTNNCNNGCAYAPSQNTYFDVGAGMRLYLGLLQPGESATFRFYYGISEVGQSPSNLENQLQALGATYWIVARSADNAYSAIMGFGSRPADVVPEPSTIATWATAAFGLGFALLRRGRRKCSGNSAISVSMVENQ